MILMTAFLFLHILKSARKVLVMKSKFFLFCLFFLLTLSKAQADYFIAKEKSKETHLWLDSYQNEGYLFNKGDDQVLRLTRQTSPKEKQMNYLFKATEENQTEEKFVIEFKKKGQDLQAIILSSAGKIQKKQVFKKAKSEIHTFQTEDMHFENDKCILDYLDLRSVKNEKVLNRLHLINQSIMSYYNDYGCDYNPTDSENTQAAEKAKLKCKSEIHLFKNRFYGVNFYCVGEHKGETKRKNFHQLYDSQLKIEIKKTDFTDSDISGEDDNFGIMFGLSPVGLFLYYTEPNPKGEDYQSHIPFYNLKKSFEKWGKPKRYLRHLEVK